ncbi:hypothetical protein F4780DRAFT_270635 [Xylariomycetidae sp. FL0641]|nr:hypothetical protein F4780DRAFT_270635 [Xylariomycetidae sp. FL0641]
MAGQRGEGNTPGTGTHVPDRHLELIARLTVREEEARPTGGRIDGYGTYLTYPAPRVGRSLSGRYRSQSTGSANLDSRVRVPCRQAGCGLAGSWQLAPTPAHVCAAATRRGPCKLKVPYPRPGAARPYRDGSSWYTVGDDCQGDIWVFACGAIFIRYITTRWWGITSPRSPGVRAAGGSGARVRGERKILHSAALLRLTWLLVDPAGWALTIWVGPSSQISRRRCRILFPMHGKLYLVWRGRVHLGV